MYCVLLSFFKVLTNTLVESCQLNSSILNASDTSSCEHRKMVGTLPTSNLNMSPCLSCHLLTVGLDLNNSVCPKIGSERSGEGPPKCLYLSFFGCHILPKMHTRKQRNIMNNSMVVVDLSSIYSRTRTVYRNECHHLKLYTVVHCTYSTSVRQKKC